MVARDSGVWLKNPGRRKMTRLLRCWILGGIATSVVVAKALADPIAPGAPLDGHDHIISVREADDGSETAASIRYTLMGGGNAVDATRNPDGSFALKISLMPGLVRCCPADEPGSDAFFIVTTATGVDVNFTSDFDPMLPQPAENDSATITNPAANRRTEFRIFSPAEPVPEPATLLLVATGITGLWATASQKRRTRPSGWKAHRALP